VRFSGKPEASPIDPGTSAALFNIAKGVRPGDEKTTPWMPSSLSRDAEKMYKSIFPDAQSDDKVSRSSIFDRLI